MRGFLQENVVTWNPLWSPFSVHVGNKHVRVAPIVPCHVIMRRSCFVGLPANLQPQVACFLHTAGWLLARVFVCLFARV